MADIEKLKNKSTTAPKRKGGARPGAGRKRGGMNQKTLDRMRVESALKQRIMQNADRILNSQLSLAQGVAYLFRIDKDAKGKDKRPVMVTNPTEIEDYLAGDYDGDRSTYHYVTTERPDNRAIDSMFDRTFGKAQQSMDITSGGEQLFAGMETAQLNAWITKHAAATKARTTGKSAT